LTSNPGAHDFQTLNTDAKPLYQSVIETSRTWVNAKNLMYVVGATKAEYFKSIRKIVPDSFLLVPGVGAQGGSLEEVCKFGLTSDIGLLVNSSRGIIYASNGLDFAEQAAQNAKELQQKMNAILSHI
jgi:orotidine-5'-phosphate decarboxylase